MCNMHTKVSKLFDQTKNSSREFTSRVIHVYSLQIIQADKLLEVVHHLVVPRLSANVIS